MKSYPFTSRVTYDEYGNPQFDRAVDAEFMRKFYAKDRGNGVIMLGNSNSFKVVANSGMTVKVNGGYAFIQGAYCYEEEERVLQFESADTLDRIDSVVLRLDDTDDKRAIDLYIIKGTPASSPTAPALTRDGLVYEIGLANVFITKNSSSISGSKITDTRLNTARCGESLPLQAIDTTELFTQMQEQIAENMEFINRAITESEAGYLEGKVSTLENKVSTLENKVNPIGTVLTTARASKSVTVGTSTELSKITLTRGTWIIYAGLDIGNFNNIIMCNIAKQSGYNSFYGEWSNSTMGNTDRVTLQVERIVTVEADNEDWYFNARSLSSVTGTKSIYGMMKAIRIA